MSDENGYEHIEPGQVWVSKADPDRVIEIDRIDRQWDDVGYHVVSGGKRGRRGAIFAPNLRSKYQRFHPHPPDEGHTFRISFESRMSSKVVGDEHHHDAADFDGIVHTVEVRAWNLRDALKAAADLPFNVLMGEDTE